jgi:transposase
MTAHTSKTARKLARFCGIDIAKNKHVACVIDGDGAMVVRSQSFANSAEGFRQILSRLQELGGPQQVAIAMEATGHYWYSLHEWLTGQDYSVAVLNPIQTARQVTKGIRKSQTDKIDAHHIAVLLKNGEQRPALIPGELAMICRQLSRLHQAMIRQKSRIKQLLWSRIHPVWPEYESLFSTPFGATGRALLRAAPTPADVVALETEALHELVRKASRGQYDGTRADEIRRTTEHSVGIHRGLPATRAGIRALVAQLEALKPIREQLETEIAAWAEQLPQYLLTLPGASPLAIVSLFGEIDPIQAFASPAQLVAFAGLDCVVSSSGQYEAPRRRISKRGSPHLRRTLWMMARQACHRPGNLRTYFLRKNSKLPYLAAVTATAVKLCPIVWRIMTDRRDYVPEPPTHKP